MTTTRKTKSAPKSAPKAASAGAPRPRTGLRKTKDAGGLDTETVIIEPEALQAEEPGGEAEPEEKEAAPAKSEAVHARSEAAPSKSAAVPAKSDVLPRTERLEKDLREALNRISLALSDSRVALSKAEQSFDRYDEVSGQVEKFGEIIENLQALHDENVDDLDSLESRLEEFTTKIEDINAKLQSFDRSYEELSAAMDEKFRALKEEDVARMQETLLGIDESRKEIQAAVEELKARYEQDSERFARAHEELVNSTLDLNAGVRSEVLDEVAKSSQALREELGGKLSEVESRLESSREDVLKMTDDVKREFIDQLTGTSAQMQRDYGTAIDLFQAETAQIKDGLTSLFEAGQKKIEENITTLVRDFSTVSDRITELQAAHEKKVEEYSEKLKQDLDEFGKHHSERIATAEKSLISGIDELKKNYTEKVEDTTKKLHDQFSAMEQSTQKLKEQSEALEGLMNELSSKEEEDALRILELQEDKDAIMRSLEDLGAKVGRVDDKSEAIKASLADEFDKTRQAWNRVEEALNDAQGALTRTKEAHDRIDELNGRVDETRTNLEALMAQMRENSLLSEANLDKAKLAMKLMEEIEDKSKRLLLPLDDMIQAIEEFEKLPESTDLGFELNDLLQVMIKHRASDLHLKVGAPPTVRLDGELIPVGNQILTDRDCKRLVLSAMSKAQRRKLMERNEVDFIYAMNTMRFRINAFLQKGSISAAFKMLVSEMPAMEELNLPPMVKKLAASESGLIIVTGPAGSGKSTSLAAIVDYINTHRKMHIITLEDPIEFIHRDKLSIVTQREIGTDTNSYGEALRQALRQDPDVILIDELRDPETIMTAVMAAENGHLVITTMHMPNAIQAINRLVSLFPPEGQKQFRLLLSNALRGILSQKLLTLATEQGRIPAVELLVVTPTIANILLDGPLQDLYPHMMQGTGEGMQTFTSSITKLLESNLITKEEALAHAEQPMDMRLGMAGADSQAVLQQVQMYQTPAQVMPSAPLQAPTPHVKQVTDAGEDLNLQWL